VRVDRHAANYQGRGSFFSTEQQSLYQQQPSWRASLGELQADFCTPSQMLVATMTAMQFVYEDRDVRAVFLARAAPRRWYETGFGVQNGPTRYGKYSFTVAAFNASTQSVSVVVAANTSQPSDAAAGARVPPTITLRVRHPTDPTKTIRTAKVVTGGGRGGAVVAGVNAATDDVLLDFPAEASEASGSDQRQFTIAVTF
jgi:hypothetical protein